MLMINNDNNNNEKKKVTIIRKKKTKKKTRVEIKSLPNMHHSNGISEILDFFEDMGGIKNLKALEGGESFDLKTKQ